MFLSFCHFAGLQDGALRLPVPGPVRGPGLLRVRSRLGSLQMHVQVSAQYTAGVLLQIRL